MAGGIDVSEVRVRFPHRQEKGVIGRASCVVSGIKLDNMVIMRLGDGRLGLGFPARQSRSGEKHFYFNPVDEQTRQALENAILGRLPPHWTREERRADP